MGLLESTTAGGYGVGFLLAGAITALTSVRVTFAATAVGVILASIWMAMLLPRQPAESPESRSSATPLAAESS
jgi:predicted MFS family arabinose efflux permease